MFRGIKVAHIVAVGNRGEIGLNGDLPWRLPEELKNFRDLTVGHAVVMGRKTVESLPKPLAGRRVYGVTRDSGVLQTGIINNATMHLPSFAMAKAEATARDLGRDKIFIAGGGEMYKYTEEIVDEIFLTRIHSAFAHDTVYKVPKHMKFVGCYKPTQEMVCKKTGKSYVVSFEKYEVDLDKVK